MLSKCTQGTYFLLFSGTTRAMQQGIPAKKPISPVDVANQKIEFQFSTYYLLHILFHFLNLLKSYLRTTVIFWVVTVPPGCVT